MIAYCHVVAVQENLRLCDDHYQLILKDTGRVSESTRPGQFINLAIPNRPDLILRRPFSVARADPKQHLLTIVYRIVGRGTKAMTDLKPGNKLDILGPLGNGWNLPVTPMNCLLLGGGCGVAPLWTLAEHLRKKKCRVVTMMGFQSQKQVFGEDFFRQLGSEIVLTTDDGTYGLHGFVCEHLEAVLNNGDIDRAYICGPMDMVKTVIPRLLRKNIQGQVSLEERMGCGFGVCLSCVTDIERNGLLQKPRVCTEGPVFSIQEMKLA